MDAVSCHIRLIREVAKLYIARFHCLILTHIVILVLDFKSRTILT